MTFISASAQTRAPGPPPPSWVYGHEMVLEVFLGSESGRCLNRLMLCHLFLQLFLTMKMCHYFWNVSERLECIKT